MAIQEKLKPAQKLAYESFKTAVELLRAASDALGKVEEEIGVEVRVTDLLDMYDSEDSSVGAFLNLLEEIGKEG